MDLNHVFRIGVCDRGFGRLRIGQMRQFCFTVHFHGRLHGTGTTRPSWVASTRTQNASTIAMAIVFTNQFR